MTYMHAGTPTDTYTDADDSYAGADQGAKEKLQGKC